METRLRESSEEKRSSIGLILRTTVLSVAVAGSIALLPSTLSVIKDTGILQESLKSDTVRKDSSINNQANNVQHKSNGHQKHNHMKATIKVDRSETVTMSPDHRKITYTFKVENSGNVAHLLTATSKGRLPGEYYRSSIYFDLSIGVVNLDIYNEAAGDSVASGMFVIDTIAKRGDKVTLEIAYSNTGKKNEVEMDILNNTKKTTSYTTGPISLPIGSSFEAFTAEKMIIKKEPETEPQAPKKKKAHPNTPIDPHKEAELHSYLLAMVKD